jgi:hypothetical protein
VAELRADSFRFAGMWDSGATGRHDAQRETIDHPAVGALTLDCDALTCPGSDQRLMVYTARPGTVNAERIALLSVLGAQALLEEL